MKIALFASSFYPAIGGVEELVRQLALELTRRGHQAIVITNRWPPDLERAETYQGVPVHRFPMRINDGPWRARLRYAIEHDPVERAIARVVKEFGAEIVHVQCVSTNGQYALRVARRLGLPLIVTAQGELTMDATRVFERSDGMNRILRDLLDQAERLTACSAAALNDLREYRGREFAQAASVIPNGISLAEFADPGVTPHEHPVPYALGIGRWVVQKGFDVLIEAFAVAVATPGFDHDLLLAGAGEAEATLRDLIAARDIGTRVHLVGRADRRLAVSLFKGCSMFVLPSRREPLGIVNLEAMAAERPVIASDVGGVPEIVRDEETGLLVAPEDPGALAGALTRLAGDPVLRHQLGRTGRRHAEAFDWKVIADRYEAVYREVGAA